MDSTRQSVFLPLPLNLVLLGIGVALLAYAHLQWAVRHESPKVKLAWYFRPLVAGWAPVAMGYLGLQSGGRRDGESH